MTSAICQSEEFWFFAWDTDTDISGFDVQLTLDQVDWFETTHDAPSATVQAWWNRTKPVDKGLTRYWVRVLAGPNDGDLPLVYGENVVRGRTGTGSENPRRKWTIFVTDD